MPYESEANSKLKTAAKLGGGILAFFLAKAAFTGGISWVNHRPPTASQVEKALDEAFDKDRDLASMYAALRANFPNEFETFRARLAESLRGGASSSQARETSFNYMREFSKKTRLNIAAAPSAMLKDYRTAQIAVLTELKSYSVAQCGRFAISGLAVSDDPSATARSLIANAVTVQIKAAKAGIDHPVKRATGELSESDATALIKQMERNGLDERQLRVFSGDMNSANEADQCSIGFNVLKSVDELSTAQADRITAFILMNS